MSKLVFIVTVPQSLIFLNGQVEFLKLKGFQVEIISSPGKSLIEFGNKHGVVVHPIPMKREIDLIRDAWSLLKLTRLLFELKPNIVNAGTPKAGLLGMCAAYLVGIKHRIYTIHGFRFETLNGFSRFLAVHLERLSSFLSTSTLVVSDSIKEVSIRERICNQNKLAIINKGTFNGVDTSLKFNPIVISYKEIEKLKYFHSIGMDDIVVGFVGRLVFDKGIQEVISAWDILRVKYKNIKLLVIGEFENNDIEYRHIAQTLFNDDRVIHLSQTDNIQYYYALMDIFLLPTYREGIGYVLLESAAMMLPVITTNVTGAKDAVRNNVTGFLIEPKSVIKIVEKIEVYIHNPELRMQHGISGRQWVVSNFEQKQFHEAICKYYLAL